MKPTKYLVSLSLAALLTAGSVALAAVAPDYLASRPELEVGDGVPTPRVTRTLTVQTPMLARRAATGQLASGIWTTLWDRDTGVASAIYGSGIDVPGSMADGAVALAAARALLAEQIDILAPGSSVDEFELVSNHLSNSGIRTIGFFQRHQGVRVVGGQVAFRFKNDRLVAVTSQAFPNVTVDRIGLTGADAGKAARGWIDRDFGSRSTIEKSGAPVILPIVSSSGRITYHTAVPVTVSSAAPIGKWTVYIGADKAPVARRQLLRFASGTVNYRVPTRWPGGEYANFPAANVSLNVDGANQTANLAGLVTFNGGTASIATAVAGPLARIITESGSLVSDNFNLADGGQISWDQSGSELADAQLTTFIHTNIAKEYLRGIDPDATWIDNQMRATVNINQSCNAFADGDNSINFFRSGQGCGNTGRLADVVYHEFGHNLHGNSIIPGAGAFDGAFSEGLSDYYAGTITDSPVMGIGFFNNTSALRHLDQQDFVYPDDVTGQPHSTGRIFATTMWDIRKMLIAKLGQAAGVAHSDQLFYAAVQRSADIPGTALEILIADDDDGNLANGTPNQCDLEEVLGAHGLVAELGGAAPGLDFPVRDRYQVSIPVSQAAAACNPPTISSVNLSWRIRGSGADEVLPMTLEGESYVAEIPLQDEGQVIQYRIEATYEGGSVRGMPKNEADPYYEFYNGATTPIYCTDFETDPLVEWTLAGGGNSWEWGAATGAAGNPSEAFSGTNIFGTELGGRYAPSRNFSATTPIVDTSGYEEVRLQYRRWLGVEDATYDRALISSNGAILWENARSAGGDVAHQDREWRFHDVDLTAQAQVGSLEVTFGLQSDQGFQLAGWNVDDVCIVSATPSVCGDEQVTGNEGCDDGAANSDSEADACRADCQPATCGDGVVDTGEQCDDGNDDDTDNCSNQCLGDGGGCGCQSSDGGGSGAAVLFLLLAFGYVRRNRKRATR